MAGKLSELIETLAKGRGVELAGRIEREDEDSLTLRMGRTLFDVPKRSILWRDPDRDVAARAGDAVRNARIQIDMQARIRQRLPATAAALGAVRMPGIATADACACACACNCACDCACACGGCGCTGRVYALPEAVMRFRSRIG